MKTVDLFAGAGGLSIGLKQAGFEPVCAVEMDNDASRTYSRHSPKAKVYSDNIENVDLSNYSGVELVCGGPPCQPFSTGGLRAGKYDSRNMIPAFIDTVHLLNPKAFLIENVPGLAVGKRREYLNQILEKLETLGYKVTWKVLNAADYGVPQSRRRLFIVGLKGIDFSFPNPTHGPNGQTPYITAGDVLTDQPYGTQNTSKITYAKKPDLRPSPYHGLLFNGGGRPIDMSKPSPTILASAGGNKTHFVDVKGEVPRYHSYLNDGGTPRTGQLNGARRLTPEESALLQSFPKDLVFCGARSSQYRQIGNAVPPKLAEALGQELFRHINLLSNEVYSSKTVTRQITLF